MGPVGLAVDLHDDGPIDDAVEERHGQRWIAEVFVPNRILIAFVAELTL
jgi:hypothetical protein